jgi:glyoxylate reductase
VLCTLADRIDKQVIVAAGGSLKVISTYSTGVDHIDVEEATSRRIYVTSTSDILTESTADLTFGLILAAARNVVLGDQMIRTNNWRIGWQSNLLLGFDVHGSTLGIIGLGRIGTAVAKRARAFSMKVLYNSRRRKTELESDLGVTYRSLEDLLNESDFVSIHTDSNSTTRHILNKGNLSLMKKTAFLINTARGDAIETAALIKALKKGSIGGACLDVFEREPLASSSGLVRMKNVVLTPHIGSATHSTRKRMADAAVNSIIQVLTGKQPEERFVVNKQLLSS